MAQLESSTIATAQKFERDGHLNGSYKFGIDGDGHFTW